VLLTSLGFTFAAGKKSYLVNDGEYASLRRSYRCLGVPPDSIDNDTIYAIAGESRHVGREALKAALSGLPLQLKERLRGWALRWQIDTAAATTCILGTAVSLPGLGEPGHACLMNDGLYLSPSAEFINRSALRVLGLAIAERLKRDNPEFLGEVSQSYLTDLAKSPYFSLSNLTPVLGPQGIKQVRSNVSGGESDLLSGIQFDNTDPEQPRSPMERDRLESVIFAEVFDSFYCDSISPYDEDVRDLLMDGAESGTRKMAADELMRSLNTRARLQDFFPNAYRKMLTLPRHLERPAQSSHP
jgi:hypothetical protein